MLNEEFFYDYSLNQIHHFQAKTHQREQDRQISYLILGNKTEFSKKHADSSDCLNQENRRLSEKVSKTEGQTDIVQDSQTQVRCYENRLCVGESRNHILHFQQRLHQTYKDRKIQ